MSILGTSVLRTEDPKFLTTGGEYIEDHRLDGMVFVAYVRSPMPHALIEGIDTSEALDMPGVVGVWTGADVDLDEREPMALFNALMTRPRIAKDRVRYAGEIVAIVAAETQAQAVDATEMVVVDYVGLDAVTDPEAAMVDGAPILHPVVGNNIAATFPNETPGDPFAESAVVVEQRIINQRLAVCPLETRGVLASWTDGKLTTWSSTQNAHGTRTGVGVVFGLDDEHIRVIAPDVGGGFGAKNGQ
jgi:carbon-monoxide dehydrogenase large subunit